MADIIKKDENLEPEEEFVVVEDPEGEDPEGEDPEGEDPEGEDPEGEEREAIRERRRQEKKDRKERRDQAIKRDKLELDFLRKRNDDLERRVDAQEQRAHRGDLNVYDQQIANAKREAEMAERVIAKAVAAGNGEDVAQAMRYRDQAVQKAQQLGYQKLQFQQAQPQPKRQNKIDDMIMHHAKAFIEEHPWYDAGGQDEDSAIVLAIDQSLSREGLDPRGEEYWEQLRLRAAKRLPEKFKKREARKGPQVGSGREHAPTSTRKEIYISPERKQALIDAGVWDDPQLRQKYVKQYAKYDREHKNS